MSLFLIITDIWADDNVYYCSQDASVGFNYQPKIKEFKMTHFILNRFKMKVDIKKKTIFIKDGLQKGLYKCISPYSSESLNCIMQFYVINFNTKSGRFVSSLGYGNLDSKLENNYGDSLNISYGTCVKF